MPLPRGMRSSGPGVAREARVEFERAGIEPGVAATESPDIELAVFQIPMVEIANLEFAARGWLQLANDIDGVLVIEIEAGDGVVGFRNLRLFNDPEGAEFGIEFNQSLSLGIVDPACECGCAAGPPRSLV